MYDRRVKGQALTFAVSGLLWEHSLVLIDRETRSYWSQLLGEAMRGKLTGSVLKTIPSVITDWKTWRNRYPESDVVTMPRTSQDYRRNHHADDDLLLIGLVLDGHARAWRFTALRSRQAVNDRLDNVNVLVAYDASTGTAVLHGRRVGHRDLSFDWKNGSLIDRETGSTWDLITGQAVSGPLIGRKLPTLAGIISYSHAWMAFHPKSTYWQP